MFINFKNSFTRGLNDKCSNIRLINHTLNAWLMAILPCYLSLITIYIFHTDPIFSDIHISQGSVATCLRHGGIFKQNLLQIYYRVRH